MEISQLRGFVAVAAEGHLTRAASVVHVSQPALSAQIAKLEAHLGVRLFDRSRRGMTLTAEGVVFLEHAQRALGELKAGQRALDQLAGLERGELRLGAGATAAHYLLPQPLASLRAAHPHVDVYLREAGSAAVVRAVIAGDLEVGVVTLPVLAPERLEIVPWRRDVLGLLVPPQHPFEGRATFEWHELDALKLVMFEAGTAIRQRIDAAIGNAEASPSVVMELRSIESIKRMVSAGVGAAFISEAAAEGHPLVYPAVAAVERQLAVVSRRGRSLSPVAERFVEMLGHSSHTS